VRTAFAELLSWSDVPSIDLVINNADIMNIPERTLSEGGIEMHFATNHIGHFLFANLMMPNIIAAAKDKPSGSTRTVNISSVGAGFSAPHASHLEWVKPAAHLPGKEKPNFTWMKAGILEVNEDMSYTPTAVYAHSKAANIFSSPWV
jgi:NAD(P)-dependent dehydrogenase (short-subunit alcohol dehydrogenase family)